MYASPVELCPMAPCALAGQNSPPLMTPVTVGVTFGVVAFREVAERVLADVLLAALGAVVAGLDEETLAVVAAVVAGWGGSWAGLEQAPIAAADATARRAARTRVTGTSRR